MTTDLSIIFGRYVPNLTRVRRYIPTFSRYATGRVLQRKVIEELLKDAPGDLPVILVDHSPTDLENVSRSRVDLQLSGHTHNGQLFPVNILVMPFQYELAWGIKEKHNTRFIVSSGLQAWGPPVKTAGISEILFIRAVFQ